MPYNKQKKSASVKPRDYDAESGKNRTKSKKPLPPPESSSESELSATESEVESEYEIKTRDVHRQKSKPARSRKVKPQTDSLNAKDGDEPAPEDTSAPGMNFLVALAYRQGSSAVQFDTRSFYVPDCYALFSCAYFICSLLSPNTLVHEVDPAFMSITFYLYTGHLFFYHILRIRDAAGELTREQRRCLRHYENVGPAEAWPIPTPFIGILASLGTVSPPSKYYGKIIPKLPSFTGFTADSALANIHGVTSIMRMPIIPAMQKFLYNFGHSVADFTDDILYPLANPILTPGAAGPPVVPPNTFLGHTSSAAASSLQTLFMSSGWNLPTETSVENANYPYAQKRALINRFQVPDVADNTNITGLESFLGFRDGQSVAWMKKLLSSSSTVCRFIPGSTNLSAIGTNTQEELNSTVHWTTAVARTRKADTWFRGRFNWTYSINGKVNTETSGFLYKAAASSSVNCDFSGNIIPGAIPALTHSAERTGPYFANPAQTVSVPLTLVEIVGQPDPIRNMLSHIDEHLYDNLGGRARS